jgi:hypothetical protein
MITAWVRSSAIRRLFASIVLTLGLVSAGSKADTSPDMLESALRSLAILASAIVALSFGLFAIDETRAASDQTAAQLAGRDAARSADPSPAEERAREQAHTSVRELIDDGNDLLTAPFAGIVSDSASRWTRRGVPTIFALLVFGFGLGYLARFTQGRAHSLAPHRS